MVLIKEFVQMIKKLLFLRGVQSKGSILNRKIKISGKQEKNIKKRDSSILSTKVY